MRCLRGREIVVSIRRSRREPPSTYHLVAPARWTKSTLLQYVRSEHPKAGVRIVEWMNVGRGDDPYDPRLLIVNPGGFSDYPRGVRST